jgi:hypothetical protein
MYAGRIRETMHKKLATVAGLILCTNLFGQELYDLRTYDGTTDMMTWDDHVSDFVKLPFTFTFHGEEFTEAKMSSNGCLNFVEPHCQNYNSFKLPYVDYTMYPFWTDLIGESFNDSKMLYFGDNDKAIFGWYDMHEYYEQESSNNFEVVLFPNDAYEFRYGNLDIFQHNVSIGTQGKSDEINQIFWHEDLNAGGNQSDTDFNFMMENYPKEMGWQGFYQFGEMPVLEEEYKPEDNFFQELPEQQYNFEYTFDPIQQEDLFQEDYSNDPYAQEQAFTNMGVSQEEFYGYTIEEPIFFEPEVFMNEEVYMLQEVIGLDVFTEQDWQPEPMQEEVVAEATGEMYAEETEEILEQMQEAMEENQEFFQEDVVGIEVRAEVQVQSQEERSEGSEVKSEKNKSVSQLEFQQQMTESIAISGAESDFLSPSPVPIPVLSNTQQRISIQIESLADQMGAQAVQTNIQNQMVSMAQSGGFDVDQTNVTTMIGYSSGFNDYTNQESLGDNMSWYVTRTIYRNAILQENRANLFRLTNQSNNTMQELVSSQYER